MLRTTLNGNILTLVTPISKATADKALVYGPLTAKDEEGNTLGVVSISKNGVGTISGCSLVCNTVIDGNLAIQMVTPMETTQDDVKAQYGKAILEANGWIDAVAAAAEKTVSDMDAIFQD